MFKRDETRCQEEGKEAMWKRVHVGCEIVEVHSNSVNDFFFFVGISKSLKFMTTEGDVQF